MGMKKVNHTIFQVLGDTQACDFYIKHLIDIQSNSLAFILFILLKFDGHKLSQPHIISSAWWQTGSFYVI